MLDPFQREQLEVRSYYHVLTILIGSPFPWKNIWRIKVPSRVAFFVWTAALRKILTLDSLRKRNIIMVDWCCMCKKIEKSIDHLFFIVKEIEIYGACLSICLVLFGLSLKE